MASAVNCQIRNKTANVWETNTNSLFSASNSHTQRLLCHEEVVMGNADTRTRTRTRTHTHTHTHMHKSTHLKTNIWKIWVSWKQILTLTDSACWNVCSLQCHWRTARMLKYCCLPHTWSKLSIKGLYLCVLCFTVPHTSVPSFSSLLQFYSDNPAILLSGPSVSEQDPTQLLVSLRTSHWYYPSDGDPLSANVTIYSSLSPQTYTLTVAILPDRRAGSGKLPCTHRCMKIYM